MRLFFLILFLLCANLPLFSALAITEEHYFDQPGLSVLVFHNHYPEGHQGGVEIILHDERIATNGDLRLEPTPGQWDPLPDIGERQVDRKNRQISVSGEYSDLDIEYTVHVTAKNESFRITVDLQRALPLQWVGKVGFNLELFPEHFFDKTWFTESKSGIFPRQVNGPVKLNSNSIAAPIPICSGRRITLAPEDRFSHVQIESQNNEISLYDGRIPDNNGWFVLRSLVPTGATENAIVWDIRPNVVDNWRRQPQILHSQVGYHPEQLKQALLELDPRDQRRDRAQLLRIFPDGDTEVVFNDTPERWGSFLRYDYQVFDFTRVTTPGSYKIRFRNHESQPFRIDRGIFKHNVWQPTLETFLPVQMCHMEVRDRFRIWHGLCHMDDALQAPPGTEHFDGYRQAAATETRYKAYEHIPGLTSGGWHDAGDYDIATGSQATTVSTLSMVYETFDVRTDQTTVLPDEHYVELFKPDGKIDILQQIEHGVRFLLAPYRISGHSYVGVISPTIQQYVHLGDASTMTDNEVYDVSRDALPSPEHRRGKMDDRWAFTNRDSGLEYQVAATLAAASRALSEYDPSLADDCLKQAQKIWDYENNRKSVRHRAAYVPGNLQVQKILATIELFKTTRQDKYKTLLLRLTPDIQENIAQVGWAVVQIFDDLNNDTFDHTLFRALRDYHELLDRSTAKNPFKVPYDPEIWGEGWQLQSFAMRHYYLHKAFPELFDDETLYSVIHWVLGRHPGSNISFVSGVGNHSLTTAYGVNRADWSYIPGGVASGTALIKPDFPELKAPWPYMWQQSEYVISGAASYIFLIHAANDLLTE